VRPACGRSRSRAVKGDATLNWTFGCSAADCLPTVIASFPVTGEHALAIHGLPLLHKDPFDRMLVAQALVEGVTLLTVDRRVAQYPGPVRRV
jgi:hypothetical protein